MSRLGKRQPCLDEGRLVSSDPTLSQPMDTREMHALRTVLDRGEMQIKQQGHLQEYTPRKPTLSKQCQLYGQIRTQGKRNRPTVLTSPALRVESSELSSKTQEIPEMLKRPTHSGVTTAEFVRIFRREARQVRELESRYEDTKRSLFDYIEVVTSSKPNDRAGGQDVYEQLADLLFFAQSGKSE